MRLCQGVGEGEEVGQSLSCSREIQSGDVSVEVFGKQRGLGREADPRCLKTSRGCGFCSPGALEQPPVLVVRLGRGG